MYELSEAAAKDIEDILDHSIVEFGVLQTETYYAALTRCLELLGDNPGMGSNGDDIRPGYHRFPHESHVIFYTSRAHGILVVRILHKTMDAVRNIQQKYCHMPLRSPIQMTEGEDARGERPMHRDVPVPRSTGMCESGLARECTRSNCGAHPRANAQASAPKRNEALAEPLPTAV